MALTVIDAQGRLKTVSTRTGPLFIGNLADPGATLGVAQKDPFNGGDWIFWLRRESSANPCESTFRHQHFSGGAVIPQPVFTGIASRGTVASPTKVLSDDYLLIVDGRGYDGSATDWTEYAVGFSDTAAQMAFLAGSDWSGTNHESYIKFKTVPNAATTPVERLRIESTGFIGHLSGAADPFASFVGHADGADYSMVLSSSNAVSGATSAGINARRSRGSFGSPSASQNGDALFTFQARGYGATGYHTHAAGAINYYASENHSDTAGGGEVHLQTTPNGTVTAQDVMLLTNSGAITSATQRRCGVYHSTTQSINDNTTTAVLFDSEDFDVGALHSTASNTSRMTVPAGGAGVYLVIGRVAFAANGTGQRNAIIKLNGTTELVYSVVPNAGGGIAPIVEVSKVVTLADSDYIEIMAYQNSGGALNIGSATKQISNHAQMIKLW